jgi:hypothetical protein
MNIDDVRALAQAGAEIRQWIIDTPFQPRWNRKSAFYDKLVADSSTEVSFAVRSSATAEDLPDASFAGQQETFLNVVGIDNVLDAMKHVFASLYNDRAISYRVHKASPTRSGAVGRRAAHGAFRPGRGRRDVHHRHRIRLQGRGLHHLQLRPGRNRGAGRRQPGRVLRPQADAGKGKSP